LRCFKQRVQVSKMFGKRDRPKRDIKTSVIQAGAPPVEPNSTTSRNSTEFKRSTAVPEERGRSIPVNRIQQSSFEIDDSHSVPPEVSETMSVIKLSWDFMTSNEVQSN
jgi:hypothetical protein